MSGYIDYQGATPDFPAFEGLDYDQWLEEADEVKEIVETTLLEQSDELFMGLIDLLITLHNENDHARTSVNGRPNLEADKLYKVLVDDFIRLDPNKALSEGYENYRVNYEPYDSREDY